MPKFAVKTREKYAHITRYKEVEAATAAEAVSKVTSGKVDYESTEIDDAAPEDLAYFEVLEVLDEDCNELDIPPDPEPNATILTFMIETTSPWDEAGVKQISDEFTRLYSGNLNIASACLVSSEDVYIDPARDEFEEDDEADEEV